MSQGANTPIAKPKLGVIPIGKRNHYLVEVRRFAQYYRDQLSHDPALELVMPEDVLFDQADIIAWAKQMESEDVDCILFAIGSWVFSSHVISAINEIHVPACLLGLSDQIANGSIGAALQMRYVLEEMDRLPFFLSGTIEDPDNLRAVRQQLRAAWVKRTLRNRRIATIGGKPMMMYQTQVNEFDWKAVFGVDFPQYDAVHVFAEMQKVDEGEARQVEKEFLARVDNVNWQLDTGERIYEEAVLAQAKLYLGFRRLQQLYDIDVFANKCMPEMSHEGYGFGYAACLATCMLNDAGIPVACEADLPAALSMYILRLLSGQPVFFADIARVNKPDKRITFFNCGTAPISMADRKKQVSLWPNPSVLSDEAVPDEYFVNHMKGACIHFDLEEGREVTILRIGGNGSTLRFHVANARTGRRDVQPEEVLGTRYPGFGLEFREDVDLFLNNTTGHHYVLAWGDHSQELKYLAQMLGVQYVHNQ
jgi:L-fucose isomerase-like protein